MNFLDHSITPLSNVKKTAEGYLIAEAFAVRSGIQRYLGSEVGRPDLPFVDVYRPEEEVFHKDSVNSFAHAPVTIDHPAGGVDAATWKDKAVGEVSTEVLRDGERLKLLVLVKDNNAITQVEDKGKRELSAGYTCDLDWVSGQTKDGKPYQAKQTNIRINHLAIVEKGRAGNCRIGDSAWVQPIADATGGSPRSNQEVTMTTKVIVLGDKAVTVAADDAQTIEAKFADAISKLAAADTAVQTKDGEIAALKQQLADAQLTPQKLAQAVADRNRVAEGYKALTGKDAPVEATDAALRKEAVKAKLGDSAANMTDEAIAGAFAAFTASVKPNDSQPDPLRQTVSNGVQHQDAAFADVDALFSLAGVPMKKA